MSDSILQRHNVRRTGRGARTLFFAHGFGCDQQMWRFVAPAFAQDWQVVLFDHAGAGRADAAAYDAERHATLAGYAEDVVAIATALELRDAVFVGHSVSATIGMLAAIRAPDRFSELVLVTPNPCYLDDPPAYHGGFTRAALESLLVMMARNHTAWADAFAPTIVGGDARSPDTDARTRELRNGICAMPPEIALAFARATFLEDHRATVPRVPVPSLVLQSTNDAIAPEAVGRWVHAHLPASTHHQLAASGHCPHMTHPVETVAAMRAYLDRRSDVASADRQEVAAA
jgi:sigma-B regulation protein RsbQ